MRFFFYSEAQSLLLVHLICPCLQVAVVVHFLVVSFGNATMEDVQLFELQEQGETQEGYSILVHYPKQTQITVNFFNGLKKKTNFLIRLLSQEKQW